MHHLAKTIDRQDSWVGGERLENDRSISLQGFWAQARRGRQPALLAVGPPPSLRSHTPKAHRKKIARRSQEDRNKIATASRSTHTHTRTIDSVGLESNVLKALGSIEPIGSCLQLLRTPPVGEARGLEGACVPQPLNPDGRSSRRRQMDSPVHSVTFGVSSATHTQLQLGPRPSPWWPLAPWPPLSPPTHTHPSHPMQSIRAAAKKKQGKGAPRLPAWR